jgi:hypothetical protein
MMTERASEIVQAIRPNGTQKELVKY